MTPMTPMTGPEVTEACARAAHEANRAYCAAALGDLSQLPWDSAPEWQRESARAGVALALGGASPAQSHEAWCARKRAEGWAHGVVKSEAMRTHPCLRPYDELPAAQRAKDALYLAVVRAMAAALLATPADPDAPAPG